MLIRPFETGIDRRTVLEVPAAMYTNPHPVELVGYVLAEDHNGRLLISFDEMIQRDALDRIKEWPCWLPGELIRGFRVGDLVDPQTGEVLYPASDGDFGPGLVTMPNWLAACLDQLTTDALRRARVERAIAADEEKRKRRERAAQLLRQEKAHEAARKKRRKKSEEPPPDQGSLW